MIHDMNWMQVESYLETDDRAVIPLGSTEQHAYLSLGVDNLLAERVAAEAAKPLGVPVFPTLNYGVTPYFLAYPGTVSLRLDTYMRVLCDVLDSVSGYGVRRILFVNGHGGNSFGSAFAQEWMNAHPDVCVKWHNWWNAPRTCAKVKEFDANASHASWMENFPWTRLQDVALPEGTKPMTDVDRMRLRTADEVRVLLGDGNLGGAYEKPDDVMQELWKIGVEETREALEGPWN